MSVWRCLPPVDEQTGELNAIIDTPRGSRNKYKWSREHECYKLGGVLPVGSSFPFDFGGLPGTEADDGDALDILVLMDEPAFVGCLVPTRLLGVIKAEQEGERNDRLLGVAANSRNHREVQSLDDLPETLLQEIEHFFASYNEAKGKKFKVLGRGGPAEGEHLIQKARS